jgi:hypothetical protein
MSTRYILSTRYADQNNNINPDCITDTIDINPDCITDTIDDSTMYTRHLMSTRYANRNNNIHSPSVVIAESLGAKLGGILDRVRRTVVVMVAIVVVVVGAVADK